MTPLERQLAERLLLASQCLGRAAERDHLTLFAMKVEEFCDGLEELLGAINESRT